MEPNVELSKARDFGDIISDTFLFIRQNLKPLLSCFFVFCGFFLLAEVATGILQQIKVSEAFNDADFIADGAGKWAAFGIETALAALFMLLFYVAMPVALLSFMALYREKGNIAPTNEEVWGYFKYYFFKVLFGSILNFILMIIGFVLCLFPGIYLYAVLSLVFPIMIVENTSYGYAFNQSFRLIKDAWWRVFGVLFVTALIVSICGMVVTVPFQAVNVWNAFISQYRMPHLSVVTIVFGTILHQLAMVLYILPMIALGLCYFSLSEAKDATGLMGRIQQLGNNDTDTTGPAEEY